MKTQRGRPKGALNVMEEALSKLVSDDGSIKNLLGLKQFIELSKNPKYNKTLKSKSIIFSVIMSTSGRELLDE